MTHTDARFNLTRLIQEASLAVVISYAVLVGGTLNGLALYEAVNLSLVILGLVGAAWLGWAWWRRQPITFSAVTAVYGIYLMGYAASSALSLDPRRSLNALCLTLLYALVWMLVSDLIRKGWPAELFTRVIVVVATLVIGLALWQTVRYELDWLAISGGQPFLPPVILRPNPLLTHANTVAAFLNLLYPIVLVGLLASRSWPARIVAGVWILMAWGVILLTSSRGGWLGTAAALAITLGLWWLAPGKLRIVRDLRLPSLRFSWRWLLAGTAALLAAVGVGLVASRLLVSPTHGAGLGSRQEFWEAAWETFLAHPIAGLGPDTFATAYMRHISIPPNDLYVRAHSQLMQMLAETGLLGLLTGGALLAAVVWAGRRRWLAATVTERRFLSGIIGGLAATVVHSFFDTPPSVPVNALVIATVAAILTTPAQSLPGQRHAGWWRLILTGMFIALLAAGVWSQSGYRSYLNGTGEASSSNWRAAASELEDAVARDPGHAVYNLASGYAYGVLAEQGDTSALPVAIQRYQAAIEREPGYGLNYANLAALYWQQGSPTLALATIEKAAQAAPSEATFWLNLGLYREQTGDEPGARQAYQQVLMLQPSWATAYYWRANDFRRAIVAAWQMAHPSRDPATDEDRARSALDAGRYDEARQLYDRMLAQNRQWASGYAGRAEAWLGLGRYPEADRDARTAIFIGSLEPDAVLRANWTLAQSAYRQGNLGEACVQAETTLDAFRWQSISGPGTYGASLYSWAIFYRLGLSADMLPQLTTVRFAVREIAWLEALGGWYEQAGDLESARRIYREALDAAPDSVLASERLAELGR